MEEVDKFNYMRAMVITDSGMCKEVAHWILEGRKMWGTTAKGT